MPPNEGFAAVFDGDVPESAQGLLKL